MNAWFTESELDEITTPVIRRLAKVIRKGATDKAIGLCDDLAAERIVLHDFLADASTAIATWACENLGEEILSDTYIHIFEQSARRQVYDVLPYHLDRSIEAALLARNCWMAHSCSGSGPQPASFQLEEDDEKFTFIMDPCGSGGRLWRMGRYGAPIDFGLTSRAYPWSYNREGFPYYCVHCAFLNEILPDRYMGYSLWPVDPPRVAGDKCRWHLYKDRKAVPSRYYERLGLKKDARPSVVGRVNGRTFSASQLEKISTFTPDRIRRRLEEGDRRGALRVCRRMAGEFLFLHNLYVGGLASGFDFVASRSGEKALGEVLFYIHSKCVKTQIQPLTEGLSRKEATSFLLFNFFLASTCGGAGYPPARIALIEDSSEITVTLDPCASGGKLLRKSAYLPMGKSRAVRETLENRLIGASARLPVPSFMMKSAVPRLVDYISETRKPSALGSTSKAYPWSGGIKGLPYYCTLCTGLLKESGCDWISVRPPASAKDSCTWRFRK